jgi:RNA polymerase sigma factor (sigma-70 family)
MESRFSLDPQYRREIQQLRAGKYDLVLSNLPLVVAIANKYKHLADLMDLVQEGNIGLMRAAEKFDAALGYQFSTYAAWWIKQAIHRYLAKQHTLLGVPYYKMERLARVLSLQRRLMQQMDGIMPTPEQLAEAVQMEVSEIRELLSFAEKPLSLDEPLLEDEPDFVLADMIEAAPEQTPEAELAASNQSEMVSTLLARLPKDEREVIMLRYGLGEQKEEQNYQQIAQQLGKDAHTIRRLEARAVQRMQAFARQQHLSGLEASFT